MELLDAHLVARRTRAAMEYAGLHDQREAASKMNFTYDQLRKIVSRSDPRGLKSTDELRQIARACDVTPGFILHGVAPYDEHAAVDDPATDDRYERILGELRAEQLERGYLERALREVLGADLERALAEARPR